MKTVATLRGQVEKLQDVAKRREHRVKRLEKQVGFYRGSRLIRLAERIVRRARRIRSRK